jgi:hypothetical protein
METPVSMLLLFAAAGIIIGGSLYLGGGEDGEDELITLRSAQALSILGCLIEYRSEGISLMEMMDGISLPLNCSVGRDGIEFSSDPGKAKDHLVSILERVPDDLHCLIRFSEGDPLRVQIPHVQEDTEIDGLLIEVLLPLHGGGSEVFT